MCTNGEYDGPGSPTPIAAFTSISPCVESSNSSHRYDQLNLPNTAGAEAAHRRRAFIEHAHSNRPHAPDYSGSDEFHLGIARLRTARWPM